MKDEPNFFLIVTVPRGLTVRDTPRSEGQGGRSIRTVPVGSVLYASHIIRVSGVPYARLIPQNPKASEWVGVSEADGSIQYVEVYSLEVDTPVSALANAITLLATAIRELAKTKIG